MSERRGGKFRCPPSDIRGNIGPVGGYEGRKRYLLILAVDGSPSPWSRKQD